MSEKDYILNQDTARNFSNERAFLDDPHSVFSSWYHAATESDENFPNGMVLSTVDQHNHPCSRVVLMKCFSAEEICFFTNYQSDKGLQLEHNPNVSLVFWWKNLMRQVRICGQAKKMTTEQSEHYFATRTRRSQIGAIVSPQSREIAARDELEEKVATYEQEYAGKELCCPEHWGGYSVKFNSFEFWQSGEHRLHDRVVYQLQNGQWDKKYLAP